MPVVPAITSISDVEFAADEESYKGAAASSDAERGFLQSDVLVLKQPILPLSNSSLDMKQHTVSNSAV